jgi:hypothetical protein
MSDARSDRYNADMCRTLILHPDSWCAVTTIDVDVARPRTGALLLSYEVTGNVAALRIPPIAAPARADELWRHTCFEVFIRPVPGEAYFEFNFAPSTQWAAYRFDGYRSGMRVAAEAAAPQIDVQSTAGGFTLRAALELDGLPPGQWKLGLSAVIEDADDRRHYWALAHPPGRPDFHHGDCFACEI